MIGSFKMEIYIAAGGLAVVILSSAITVVWKLSRIEISIRADYGRQVAELQAKVYQVEIWARDEFVRKGSFETVVTRLENTMLALGTKIENAVDKMAVKIENMNHHG
jgi:hypothetical protein